VNLAVGAFLGLAVAVCWLGAAGFARLRAPLDRVHCVTFVNVAGGLALLVAAVLADGVSDRCLKILLVLVVNLVGGAVVSHMTGRAVTQRAGGA